MTPADQWLVCEQCWGATNEKRKKSGTSGNMHRQSFNHPEPVFDAPVGCWINNIHCHITLSPFLKVKPARILTLWMKLNTSTIDMYGHSLLSLIGDYFDDGLISRKTKAVLSDSSILNVNTFWFICFFMTVNWKSLSCGQNKTFEVIILGFGKDWLTFFFFFFTIFWHFIDQTMRRLFKKSSTDWFK